VSSGEGVGGGFFAHTGARKAERSKGGPGSGKGQEKKHTEIMGLLSEGVNCGVGKTWGGFEFFKGRMTSAVKKAGGRKKGFDNENLFKKKKRGSGTTVWTPGARNDTRWGSEPSSGQGRKMLGGRHNAGGEGLQSRGKEKRALGGGATSR